MDFWKFCSSVWNHWEARFGTTFAVALAVAQYAFLAFSDPKRVPTWVTAFPPSVWLAVGALLLFWSCYAAWHDEFRGRLKAEQSIEDRKPDIKGQILMTFWETARRADDLPDFRKGRYFVKLELVNHSNASCTISGYRMCQVVGENDIRVSEPGRDFVSAKIKHTTNFRDSQTTDLGLEGAETYVHGSPINAQWPLARGAARGVWVEFDLRNHLPDFRADGPDCIQEIFYVEVTDSLGNKHTIAEPPISWVCLGTFS